jgi:MFS transporter, DHA2 family, multidrug resistance protein
METPGARRWWALGALTLAVLAVGLDGTVLSVALPTLATDLHASTADLQWFVSGYTLVLAAAMLPGGLLGDRYGRKKILLVRWRCLGPARWPAPTPPRQERSSPRGCCWGWARPPSSRWPCRC